MAWDWNWGWWGEEEDPDLTAQLEAEQQGALLEEWRRAMMPTAPDPTPAQTDPFAQAQKEWASEERFRVQMPAAKQYPDEEAQRELLRNSQQPQINSGWTNRNFTQEQQPAQDALAQLKIDPGVEVGYSFDRPNTGAAIEQTQQGLLDTQTIKAPTVSAYPDEEQQRELLRRQTLGGEQPQQEDWLTRNINQWINDPIDRAAAGAGEDVGEWYAKTPGAQYAAEQRQEWDAWARPEGQKWSGSWQPESLGQAGWDAAAAGMGAMYDYLYAPGKAVETTTIPYTGELAELATGRDEDISLGQLASAYGEALNKALNPLNPNQVDASYMDVLTDGGETLWSLFTDNLRHSQQVRSTVEALPPELRDQANISFVNLISGPESVERTVDSLLNQDTAVQELYRKADEALQSGDDLAAARYGQQAEELKNKTKTQLIDEHANPWADFLGGVIFDPTNLITGVGEGTVQAARTAQMMNLSPEQAVQAIARTLGGEVNPATWGEWLMQPLDDGMRYADNLIGENAQSWWNKVNPFALTKDTQAHNATDILFRTATQILADAPDKAAARTLIDAWTTDPSQLVQGLIIPGMENLADVDGLVKFGGGLLANQELLQQYPMLLAMRDNLLNLRSLAGDGAINPVEMFAELNDTLYRSSRQLLGLQQLDELPSGAASFRVIKSGEGFSVLEYLDKAGKVIDRSAEMLPYDAQLAAKSLRNAAKTTGGTGVGGQLANAWSVQKSILSDMYLGMSPGYWVKNALSATATLLSDNTYTLLPTRHIMNDFMTKFGGAAPTTRAMDAATGAIGGLATETTTGAHWTERLFGGALEGNPYAKMMARLYQIPFGSTDIAGRVPFGEQNFALRATYVPFKRFLTENWRKSSAQWGEGLIELGIDPALAKGLVGAVTDMGVNGNKQQLVNTVKSLVGKRTIPFNLSELGVPDELISAEGWSAINRLFGEALPNQLDEAAAEVRRIFADEFRQAGDLLNSAPPQPGRYVWTEFESVQDGADVVDTITEAAKRSGADWQTIKSQAEQMMNQAMQAERDLWGAFRQQLSEVDNERGLNVAMDLLGQWYDWRRAARQQVDTLSRAAIEQNTPDAWAAKWQGTQEIYQGFGDFFGQAVQTARENLLKLSQGQDVPASYDWMDVIKRYASYDEADIARARGTALGSVQEAGNAFESVIDANRQYVDKSFVELFSAFRRYPTQGGLDFLADGVRKVEALGAQAAAFLAGKRAEMLPNRADAYYQLRNATWAQFFDNAVIMNNVNKRLLVAQGLAEQAKTGLRWVDEFAGGEFQLVGKLSDGVWQALNTATGEIARFADPVALAQKKTGGVVTSSIPEVPPGIVQDFYRLIGESTNMVDALIREIDTEAAAKLARQEVEMMSLLDEPVRTPSMRWVGPDPNQRIIEQAQAASAGSQEARAALATEWDRIAKASAGYTSIDQTIATYTRNGIVNVPENRFEDLYGQTIAGRTINNQEDVNRLLQEYYDLGQQAKRAPELAETSIPAAVDDALPAPLRYRPSSEQLAKVDESIRKAIEASAKRKNMATAEVERYVMQALNEMTQHDIAVAVPKSAIDSILNDGRMRNYLETGTSGATMSKSNRTAAEAAGLGIPEDLPAAERPIYGYLNFSPETRDAVEGDYGEISFILRNEVRPRTTITAGDSMYQMGKGNLVGVPIDNPNVLAADHEVSNLVEYAQSGDAHEFVWSGAGYVEAQVQGGVSLNDIRTVLDKNSALTPEQVKRFADRGIQVIQGDAAKAGNFVATPLDSTMSMGLDFGSLIQRTQELAHRFGRGAEGFNPFGLIPDRDDVLSTVQGLNDNLSQLMANKAPEMGEVALHTVEQLRRAEEQILKRLPELLQGKPNTLTTAQQLAVIDQLQKLLPQYDNVLAGAVDVGEKMGNFAMLNYNDRRNLDTWLGMLMPYHYFWSRSAKNWMKRAASKPGIVNFWYESEEAIRQENLQNEIPRHLQGTIQNPLPFGPDRLGNPLLYALPFAMYQGSDFVNPDDAKSEAERWMMTIQKFSPAMYPMVEYARKAILDQTTPLPGGRKRTDDWQLGDIIPGYRMAGYARQAMTGEMGPQGPLAYGDEYDYGRAGKQVGLSAMRGEVDPGAAMWAPDVGYQLQTGASALPEQDPGAVGAWRQGAQQAGWERLANRAMSYFFGVPGYYLSDEEKQMREMKGTRVGLGYNEVNNPWGSRAAVDEYTGMGGDQFEATFNYSQLYPTGDDRKRTRPGERAAQSQYYDEFGVVMDNMNQAVIKYLLDNPEATSKDVNDIKSPFWDQVDELKGRYPSLPERDTNRGLNTKYMTPAEHAQKWIEKAVGYKPEGKPAYPGPDANAEDKKAYYLAKAAWDEKRLNHIDRTFSQLLMHNEEFPDAWKEQARQMVEKMYASELLRGHENRFASDVEKAWSDRQSFVEEVEDAEWKYREKAVVDRLGQEAYDLIQEYYALPKEGDARKQFKQANPVLNQAFMASYNPEEYDKFVEKFGADAFDFISAKPAHPGDGASEAQLQAYYKELTAYNKKYPQAEAAQLWMKGRRFGAAEGSDSYGPAYDEAIAIFGPNIFDILNSFPSGGTKEERAAWYKAHPQENMLRSGYLEWKKEFQDKDKESVGQERPSEEEGIISNAGAGQGYTGPRPVGSERQALGTFDPLATDEPNQWTGYNWDNLLNQPAANPWTQRANELNAGLLGDEAVPSEMATPRQGRSSPWGSSWGDMLTGGEMGPQPKPGAPKETTTPTGAPNLELARKYAMMDEGYVKGEMSRQQWAARRGSLVDRFGDEAGAMWDEYYNLPKGEKRKQYIAEHPEMRMYNLAAYNPKEYGQAVEIFGQDAISAWAKAPRYEDTAEAKAARSAYWDANPKAFLFHSWLNGRPANNGEGDQEGEFKYNFGADYNTAKGMFGDDIWGIVEGYKRGWDKTQKRLYHEKYPQLGKFFDWWYGNSKEKTAGTSAGAGRGGGGWQPFGGYNKAERPFVANIQPVYAREMARGLADAPRIQEFRPAILEQSGARPQTPRIREWSPDWIRGLRK